MIKVFKNARIIDSNKDFIGSVEVINGKVSRILNDDENFKADEVVDVEGKILMPSFIDLHAHFRDPGFTQKEDLYSGSRAALKGGYSTVCLMANTKPKIDNVEIYNQVMAKAKKITDVDIVQIVAVTKDFDGETLIDYSKFPNELRLISDDGTGINTSKSMYEAILHAKNENKIICIHAEDSSMSKTDYRIAEDLMTMRDIYLAKKLDARIHLCHVSTIDSICEIRKAKKDGVKVTCEITPHHIALYDNDFKVNPPIRTKQDVEALIEAVKDDTVDAIATDHAPHTKEDKLKGSPGLIGLESAFCICNTVLCRNNNISLKKLSNLMSYSPAKILGQSKSKGLIEEGYNADFVIVDTEQEVLLNEEFFESKSKNTPFVMKKLFGKIFSVYKDGDKKYDSR